jgi:alpha-L-rhamnosidase
VKLPETTVIRAARAVFIALASGLFILAQPPSAMAGLTVGDLRCEYLENPLGIDVARPRLCWVLNSTIRGEVQTAWQVLVASSEARLKANQGDYWDSGRVQTDDSIQVSYAGRSLGSHAQCFWKVRVWDRDGRRSTWSRPAKWTTGMLEPADWKAKWVGLEKVDHTNYLAGTDWIWSPAGEPAQSAPPGTNCFRRKIIIPTDREITRVRFQYTGDNECRGWVNGRDVGARNNYRTVKDNDITCRLGPGTNVIALTGRNLGPEAKPAGVVGLLEIEFAHGPRMVVPTDEQWKVSDREVPRWSEPDFDDSTWVAARKLGPVGMAPWGPVRTAESRRLPARYLRKEFAIGKEVRRGTVYFSGLGLSELFLNGRKLGDYVLSPGLTEYPKRVFYVTFDVTEQLRRGQNAMGVVLGNGRFYSPRSKVYAGMPSYGSPKLLLHLRIEYTDGSVSEVVSDETWKLSADGPIIANNEYDGEEYDARKEFPGWSRAGFRDVNWQPAQVLPSPPGMLAAQMIPPMRVMQTLRPVALTQPRPGVFVFDLGQNMVGWCQLRVSGQAGTHVSLRHAETLKADGMLDLANIRGARVTDTYTLKGSGTATWEPAFTYHGFRYVEMRGFPGKPSLASLSGRVVHDDLRAAGEFSCSNPLLNGIYRNVVWGVKGNYRSIPTDCPQRDERQGWLGDRGEESLGETYLFDNAALYAKWLQDMADAQKPSGSVPDVCPAYWPIYSDNVTWPSTSVIIPDTLHRQFADSRVIRTHYESASKWVDYMCGFVTNGIISRDAYGDWCVPPEDPKLIHSQDPGRRTDPGLLATAYFYHDLRLMEQYANMLAKTSDARRYGQLAGDMKAAFNAQFLHEDLGYYDNGTQTSCVLPLAFGLVPAQQQERVFDHLVQKINNESHGHIGTGLIGGQYLNRVLSEHGRGDLAYTIASQRDYPSWGYMLGKGATTIWELWNGDTADPGMNSGNHVMLVGDLVVWLYESLAGIRPDPAQPGFKHIIMKPEPVGDLTFVKATHRSPYGLVASHWQRSGSKFDWQITVPANTTASVYVPARTEADVKEGGTPASLARGVEFHGLEAGRAVFHVGSGRYHFTVKWLDSESASPP